MKKVTAAVLFVCILLSACSAGQTLPTVIVSDAVQSEQASVTPEQTSEPSPSPSPSPVAEPTEYETEAPLFSGFTMEPNEGTVIIAEPDGTILFGYSNGRWLTHSQAAAYCGEDMKFYSISLNGGKSSVNSKTAELVEYEAGSSVNNDHVITYDSNNDIMLKVEGKAKGYICRIDPARIPVFKAVKNYSSISRLLQPLVDEQFGEGCVTLKITFAVQADIDGDKETETIVNASNLEGYDRYDESQWFQEGNWYSIICAIEQNGSFTFIQESYDTGLKEDAWSYMIRGVADVNGDGICEILTENEGWEYWGMYLCFIEDNKLVPPMIYDWVA